MPRARECDFCGDDIEPGTGTMFVRTNGATVHYCSSKCEKNHNLGREARNLEWTEAGRPEETEAEDEAEAETAEPARPEEEPAAAAEVDSDLEAAEREAEEADGETDVEAGGAEPDDGSENEAEEETEAEV